MLRFLAAPALAVLVLQAAPLAAQSRSAVSSADLSSAVTDARSANRASILNFLQNDRVIAAAKDLGANIDDLSSKVATLDDATLSSVADRTRAADMGLAGGKEYVIISTTAIIIILLILILVT